MFVLKTGIPKIAELDAARKDATFVTTLPEQTKSRWLTCITQYIC